MLKLLLFTALVVTGYTTDIRQRLGVPPAPVKGFNINAYLGNWYVQFRVAPCSWSGSNLFTDFEQNIMPGGQAGLANRLTWRSRGTCNRVTGKYFIVGPGVFNNIDNTGDSYSGRMIVTATDYKTFVIHWSCIKMSAMGDRCEDPYISIATRKRFPSPIVINIIETILRTRWGISIMELQKVSHSKPCPSKTC